MNINFKFNLNDKIKIKKNSSIYGEVKELSFGFLSNSELPSIFYFVKMPDNFNYDEDDISSEEINFEKYTGIYREDEIELA